MELLGRDLTVGFGSRAELVANPEAPSAACQLARLDRPLIATSIMVYFRDAVTCFETSLGWGNQSTQLVGSALLFTSALLLVTTSSQTLTDFNRLEQCRLSAKFPVFCGHNIILFFGILGLTEHEVAELEYHALASNIKIVLIDVVYVFGGDERPGIGNGSFVV